MNFEISADTEGGRWRGHVTFGEMVVWETLALYADRDAAVSAAQLDLVEGIGYAIRANFQKHVSWTSTRPQAGDRPPVIEGPAW